MGRATVQAFAVVATQDRPGGPLPDGQVDGPCRAGDQGNERRLVPLPNDAQGPVAALEA